MCETWHREASPFVFESYAIGLDGIPIEDIERAARQAIQVERFMPPPARIRELCTGGNSEDRAELAWLSLVQAIRVHGAYASVNFEDPATWACVRSLGGWLKLCDSTADDLHGFVRPKFLKAYRAHDGRAAEAEPMAGLLEMDPQGQFQRVTVAAPYLPGSKAPGPPKRIPRPREEPKRLGKPVDPAKVLDLRRKLDRPKVTAEAREATAARNREFIEAHRRSSP